MSIEKNLNSSLAELEKKHSKSKNLGSYIYYTKLAIKQFEARLEQNQPHLKFISSKTWINSTLPFLSATPDGLIVNVEGDIVASVEIKTHSENNYCGRRYDSQVMGHIEVTGAKAGVIVSLLKKEDAKINVRTLRKGYESKLQAWDAMVGAVMSKMPLKARKNADACTLRETVEHALIAAGYSKPKNPKLISPPTKGF